MRSKLPILTLIAALQGLTCVAGPFPAAIGQDKDPAPVKSKPPPPPATQSQQLLRSAIDAIEHHRSVSANMRQRVDLFGKQVVGSGSYREVRDGPVPLLRYELTIQTADQPASLLQVCDGRYLWIYRKVSDEQRVSRIDAVRVTRAMEQARAAPVRDPNRLLPGIGGLSRLMRGLHADFEFTSAERGHIRELPVWRIEGTWKPALLARLLPKQKEAIEQGKAVDLARLPEHLPDRVALLLGEDDLFPYGIEYCRTVAKGKSLVLGQPRPLVTMELFEVGFDVPIDPQQFVYNPGSIEVPDHTERFLQSLGLPK